ncbi:protein MALE DISCOVERER 2-like [Phragmites australis]|uniref:protein MALE DISCOVERER 2-like n=1 Tax=Phragmites australis TaxID=29695 RepID=UPI002D77BC75|nr:protein MALE DISCOVERER 2-like [Phragmites australis]XP_062203192.1 protein MALE DISCOVERER 2-like [Phragmites australis]XP_062203193.1 protein MALE DISCOVERER 2-like [Phragmites australis]XP_062203194.1 protein MALE DISCOVERER 2-like [Phragmites australis]XP_062203195.1 protein MALE DISCOVERER 2-like [Phragmites australis]XP_062203196.1 protein MALE DISCOVERER 2-like [Phragmites australis]
MEILRVRAAYFLFFSLLVSEVLGSCASISEEGRALLRFRDSIADDGKTFLLKDNKLSGEMSPDLQKLTAISDALSDGGLQPCRKCLTKTIQGVIQRRLLREQQGPASSTQTSGEKPHVDPPFNSTVHELETRKFAMLPHWAIYTLAISGAVLLVVVATIIYLLFCRRKKDTTVMPWSTGLSGPLTKAFVAGVPSLGRAELQAACEDFINVIGTTSDCTLYKGTLSSGVEIAVVSSSVNSAEDWSDRSEEQFRNKISVLSGVNHKNFMNLLGYCACDEPFTRMMVFEYAPCGSLFEHLHIREAEDLDWPTRLRIIMGVAYCLEHMSQLDPPVMPTTLSSSSIYLTEDYAAKISDIEFCKDNKDAAQRNNSTDQQNIVYKFGILLLEVISGRLPFSEDHSLLVLWASSYLDGKRPLGGMADPTLRSSAPNKDVAALCDVVRVCISPEREKRPAMAEVARLMRGVTAMSPEQATPRDNPLWWAELEIASSEAG